jgi:hypothetical protein
MLQLHAQQRAIHVAPVRAARPGNFTRLPHQLAHAPTALKENTKPRLRSLIARNAPWVNLASPSHPIEPLVTRPSGTQLVPVSSLRMTALFEEIHDILYICPFGSFSSQLVSTVPQRLRLPRAPHVLAVISRRTQTRSHATRSVIQMPNANDLSSLSPFTSRHSPFAVVSDWKVRLRQCPDWMQGLPSGEVYVERGSHILFRLSIRALPKWHCKDIVYHLSSWQAPGELCDECLLGVRQRDLRVV